MSAAIRQTLVVDAADAQETFFERGWTDGLPIVPPTPDRVATMLEESGLGPDAVLGEVARRDITIHAEQVAVQAVMAGCLPLHFPVVVAAVQAILDPAFNPHVMATSTGGAAFGIVVSGPFAAEIGMNGAHGALGPGNRANATIGRATRLMAANLLQAKVGRLDGSALAQPGKFTLCFAEDPPPAPWQPLHREFGLDAEETSVSVIACEGPRQVGNHLNEDPAGLLRSFAAAMRCPGNYASGKGGQAVVVLGPEHAAAVIGGGWSRQQVQGFLCDATRITPDELVDWGVVLEHTSQHDMVPGEDGRLPGMASPDDILVVTAGGHGAGWSAYLHGWPTIHTRIITRRVARRGLSIPVPTPPATKEHR